MWALVWPVQVYSVRVEHLGPGPRVVLSETLRGDFEVPDKLRWLELPPPWVVPQVFQDIGMGWRESGLRGSGPFSAYCTIVQRPDVPWTTLRIGLTLGGMACVLWGVRLGKRYCRSLFTGGFEVQAAEKQTTIQPES